MEMEGKEVMGVLDFVSYSNCSLYRYVVKRSASSNLSITVFSFLHLLPIAFIYFQVGFLFHAVRSSIAMFLRAHSVLIKHL